MRRRERLRRNFSRACKHRSVPMQLFDLIHHKFKINTHWESYYRFGFYRGDKSWDERSRYVAYAGSRYWPWEGNSLKFDRLFLLKSLQKSILVANNLPTPPLLMRVGRDYAINTIDHFRAAMADVDRPVMTKFDGGGSGVGIYSIVPEGGSFRCGDRVVDADWIWRQYETAMQRGFLVEEKARNHPLLDAVNPGSLNTLRMTTVKRSDGTWHLILPYVKFGRSGVHVDNLDAGGLFAAVDASGAVVGAAHGKKSEDSFENHPDSGVAIEGFQIPFFEEACQLALNASRTFGFMATIAWDVGITPDGPTIIEGNPYWDPEAIQDKLGPYLSAEVAAGIVPRAWFTPWDRTHMYPHYMKDAHGGWWQRTLARRRQRWETRLRRRLSPS